ncbi:MAG TPA: hypothetical protein EYQ06_08340, partial [Flavobacteriales bacterium]|nr:hypothetical protein [Flavobacteriales bacterium]
KALLFIFTFCYFLSFSQSIYNPQYLYDAPGGLYEKDSLRNLHVDFYTPNYHSILVDSFFLNPKYRIPAMITLNGISYDSVGVRYKGNSTFCLPNDAGNPKLPYNIDMNYFVSGQKLLGYKKLKLPNAWLDATFAKEFVAAKIYRNYLPSPEVNLITLYVQGNYLGVYVNTESINKQFLKKHFDEKSGALFKCDPVQMFCDNSTASGAPDLNWLGYDSTLYYDSYTLKSEKGWEELLDLINTLNNNFSEIDSVLNVDRVLWAFAVNSAICNLDTYNGYYLHNYYLYQTKDGLFQMIPWDLDNSFLGAILGFTSPTTLYERDPYYGDDPTIGRPLLAQLLNNPLYRNIYTAHLRTVINESLDTAVIRGGINQLQALAHNAVDADQNKNYSLSEYYDNVENHLGLWWRNGGIMVTIDGRKAYLQNHPEISLIPPTITNVTVNNSLVTAGVFNGNTVELMVTESEYNSKFQAFTMLDDGLNGDAVAGDGIFTTALPFQGSGNDVKFYIRAENDDALMLNPERAEYEFYVYSAVSGIVDISLNNNRRLIKIIDMLGRTTIAEKGVPLFYIYDNGIVEKKIIIE